MTPYRKENATLSNIHLNKVKSAIKTQTETTLRMKRKMFQGDVPHILLLTTRQRTKLCNA